jgi:hypothetical protein
MIDPSFWTDEKLGECTRDERLLFMGLISNADDEGCGRANPKLLKSIIFPYDDLDMTEFEKWLNHLKDLNLITLYAVDGQAYYSIPKFTKHQTINKPIPSTLPKPLPDDYRSTTVVIPEDYRMTTAQEKRKEKNRKEIPPLSPTGEMMFIEFWESYPKKVGKRYCHSIFEKLNPDRALVDKMLLTLSRQKQSSAWLKDQGQFIPNPSTWLNQGRWEDELEPTGGTLTYRRRDGSRGVID